MEWNEMEQIVVGLNKICLHWVSGRESTYVCTRTSNHELTFRLLDYLRRSFSSICVHKDSWERVNIAVLHFVCSCERQAGVLIDRQMSFFFSFGGEIDAVEAR